MNCADYDSRYAVGRPITPRHDAAKPRTKKPSIATMERWMDTGIAKALDGCRVEPDGTCPHGSPSWMLVLGMI